MEHNIKRCINCDNAKELEELLNKGLDPNFEGGWPIRLAARRGSYVIVRTLIQYGANPHLIGESGASTLQLAVYSAAHWETDRWTFLLSFCDSSQLADGAAVAIIFNNVPALVKILQTGRCNTNIPTTLTGKTVEALAKGYKLQYLLAASLVTQTNRETSTISPRISRPNTSSPGEVLTPRQHPQRNLSPSVARFFHQTAGQTSLTPPRTTIFLTPSPSHSTVRSPQSL